MPDVSGYMAHGEMGGMESKRKGKDRGERERANEKRERETVSLDHSPTKLTGPRVSTSILKLILPLARVYAA